ncbi:MAG TPA: TrkH family potassium uptake protein [Caldisericia bacterium]|jgi:trk system potassium uptake protein TrkH|nr:TrkH family potassium uptake protein [Caldisericia bacterium]HPB33207.1 TrkH family potassium uptake protein [Caldisericia bacterium]HQL66702.1 TrkH family potassium uptake protein [Caldisericia bacterium]HQN47981.1 TrkH family potassium uptake protein [Caldisericia bacterium]HQO99065.1 TrkH family potassium uptake protein [Caldisericia bacterium]
MKLNNIRKEPARFIILTFLLIIIIGGLLLSLPISSKSGKFTNPIDALFTANSATCVTGLVVVDTGTHYTFFGQIVILILIQIGGLSYMTIFTFLALLLGRKIPLLDRIILKESINFFSVGGIIKLARRILFIVLIFEGVGAVILASVFVKDYGILTGLFYGIFHSVSAFCNSGFDLLGNFISLTNYKGNILLNITVMLLIITGGIGFGVISEIIDFHKSKKLSLHTKLVLTVTAILIISGTILIFLFERNNLSTLKSLTIKEKILTSIFQAVTPRTAGFNTINIGYLNLSTLILLILFMFIGASPGGTGGGIKTSTFAIILMNIKNTIKGREGVTIYDRCVDSSTVKKSYLIFTASIFLIFLSTFLLSITENFGLINILFEVTSAFGTVGLSTGITPYLSPFGKIIIMFTMFAGRVGILSILTSISVKKPQRTYLPEDKVMVG